MRTNEELIEAEAYARGNTLGIKEGLVAGIVGGLAVGFLLGLVMAYTLIR